jgi:Methyltransferase domain
VTTEDAWSPPTGWCPHPEWWHADDGDGTELEVTELAAALVRALQPEVAVETGSYLGQTSYAIGVALQRNGHGRLYTVECVPDRADQARERCAGLPVEVVTGSSLYWSWQVPRGVGFAWIDGCHDRAAEIAHLLPAFAPGAVIGLHDTAPHHPYAAQVGSLIAAGLLQPIMLRTPRGVMLAEVTMG